MKKTISIMLLVIIVFNTLLPNFVKAETSLDSLFSLDLGGILTEENFDQYLNSSTQTGGIDKTDTIGGKETSVAQQTDRTTVPGSDQGSFIASTLALLISAIPHVINQMMTIVVEGQQFNEDNAAKYSLDDMFTIEKLVFGEYDLFDINFFKTTEDATKINTNIKEGVAAWYYTIRNAAIILSLIVLIYIAIRMAISTAASDGAKYKKMFKAWAVSFALIFLLHYIVAIMISLSDTMVQILNGVRNGSQIGFEVDCIKTIVGYSATGWSALWYAILYAIIIYYQIKFFVLYVKRFIVSGFLLLISPLVTVTYSIDKAKDNKAQAFQSWFTEITLAIFIQPLHALLFLIFMVTAGAVIQASPVVAIMFLLALSKGEKILRQMFNLKGSLSTLDDSFKFNFNSLVHQ